MCWSPANFRNMVMEQRMLNIGVTTLIVFSFTVIFGGQRAESPRQALEDVLSSRAFRNTSPLPLQCEMTAYCPGPCCNTEIYTDGNGRKVTSDWSNRIAAGDISIEQLRAAGIELAAVDRSEIPFGSIIRYEHRYYAALDCGSKIKGYRIDLLLPSHARAEDFGRKPGQSVTVWIPNDPEEAVREIIGRCR